MENLDPRIRQQVLTLVRPKGKKHLRPWHGAPPVSSVLVGVNSSIAVWRPYPGANSIRDFALHIAYFENAVANKLSGTSLAVEFELRKRGWPVSYEAIEEKQWRSERSYIRKTSERLAKAVISFDPRQLGQIASEKSGMTAMEYIHGIVDHRSTPTRSDRLGEVWHDRHGVHPRDRGSHAVPHSRSAVSQEACQTGIGDLVQHARCSSFDVFRSRRMGTFC